jgi:hypothetical protein
MAIQRGYNGVNEGNDWNIRIHTEIDRNKWWVAIQRSLDSPNQHSGLQQNNPKIPDVDDGKLQRQTAGTQ